MAYPPRVVLNCLRGYRMELDAMVEEFLRDGVRLVAVVGQDCERVEEVIDELVVGLGDDASRFLLTSSHPGESVEDAVAFAQSLSEECAGEVAVVSL
jgi:hypothetical protein